MNKNAFFFGLLSGKRGSMWEEWPPSKASHLL